MLLRQVDPTYPFLKRALAEAGIDAEDARIGPDRQFVHKDAVKLKVRANFWTILDAALGALAGDCRARGLPLIVAAIPRAGRIDTPSSRAASMARLTGVAARLTLPLVDLTSAFDRFEASEIELAAWDDHPNALGHRRIFLGLARAIAEQPELYRSVFGVDPLGAAATAGPSPRP
jgi:hypothetical protein